MHREWRMRHSAYLSVLNETEKASLNPLQSKSPRMSLALHGCCHPSASLMRCSRRR